MKITRYSRYTGEDAGAVDLEELLSRLSDFLLGSGFGRSFYEIYEMDPAQTLEQLRQAILEALAGGDLLPPDLYDRLFGEAATGDSAELDQLLDALIQALFDQGYLSSPTPQVLPPSVTGRCANCSGHWAKAVTVATTRVTWRRVSNPVAPRARTNLATPSIWTSPKHCGTHCSAAVRVCPSRWTIRT